MRTHFLGDLEIRGKEKVTGISHNLDLYRLHQILSLAWETQQDEVKDRPNADLTMTLAYDSSYGINAPKEAEITFRFIRVARCKLPELTPLVFLSEVEVEDVRDTQ